MPGLSRKARMIAQLLLAPSRLRRLGRDAHWAASPIARSIRAVTGRTFEPEERAWIERIEGRRAEMDGSAEPISRIDYGAGRPDSDRTDEAMRAGVEIQDTVGRISRTASKPYFWCCVLFGLIRETRPASCVEMGTAVGVSAAYQAAALTLNGQGELATIEGSASLAAIAEETLHGLGLGTADVIVGRFQDRLTEVLSSRRPVDYVFVDGHHDEQATLAYFDQVLPFLSERALLVFDDIAWSPGMTRTWHAISSHPRVTLAVDLGHVGVCVVGDGADGGGSFSVPLWGAHRLFRHRGMERA